MDGALQDAAQRISPEPGAQAGSGGHRESYGAVLLWRRRRASQGVCPADSLKFAQVVTVSRRAKPLLHRQYLAQLRQLQSVAEHRIVITYRLPLARYLVLI